MLPQGRVFRCWMLAATMLAGCARVGPDFQPQHETWSGQWTSEAIGQASEAGDQPDMRQWWQVFNDPVLEHLITEADANDAGVRIAGLRVMEARAQLGMALAGRYPQMQQAGADAMYVHSRQSGPTAQTARVWEYSAGVDVGWELDFWGKFARAIESADAAYFAAQANHENVLVLLHAQLAQTYYALRTAEARVRIARENARLQKRSYEITERLFKAGESDELDLQQAKTQYFGTLSSIPELERQIALSRNAVAILLGRPPGPIPELGEASGKEGVLPRIDRAILQDVPANLLLRRPDIRAAEFQIAAQSAQIGVAKADLYPSVTLVGSIGWSATSLPGTQNGLLLVGGPSLRWNIFDYGRIHNNVRVQDARLQQLILTYQNDVRVAAREADDAASGLLKALEREEILREAAYSAERSLTLANTLFKEGYSDFQRVLDAQRALFAQQDAYLVNRSNAVGYLIDLYKALGGGWYSEQPLVDPATRDQMRQRTDWGDLLDEPPRTPPTSNNTTAKATGSQRQ
ncbi:NodT family efflux transporter outer membrane factor (OMF) lipoprotein [Cupriavidus metallidurans]|jgi:NodT family efflux transporter outer membrane factor (OMF) lipoprotein|uniref:Outer membrane heavy metal efflux protein n=1 Tax=Cupriavidus metallidurans (strain ATCC 43123 / DSM 2839 / NBRC 102507 / CH34) TaxID=266264 RepID=Q1LMN5_CUPMC|nr:TolC family protein [Cupriavidus metallidurans]ABF08591.1 outer membrane heavy metal efflux protein [Cupriavidus metallidurans CH34]MDE4917928.1 TolC family protein [Cupriavidus metallidurans]QGS30471.1 efflux transporter outer membrane subunit [Cupriavidus metallidurans]UBM12470.1 TolC family protein [Cupriavidus metallidurans]